MDIRYLQYFHAVAKAGSFSRAADLAFITQPALSQAIKALERDLGCCLFHRGRNISLTAEGERLAVHCQSLFHYLEDIRSELAGVKTGQGGTIRAALLESILIYVLPEVIAEFSERYPGIQYQFSKADSQTVEQEVLAGNAHFGLISRRPTSRDLEDATIGSYRHVIVASRKLSGNLESLLRTKPLFLLNQKQSTFLQHEPDVQVIRQAARLLMPINCVAVVRQFVARGMGLALLPEYVLEKDLRVLKTFPDFKMPLVLIRKKKRRTFPASEAFMGFLKKNPGKN